ncbi:hypothetical protein A7L45_15600 [Clostridium estertheticum subsp. estertheticum]|uniref:Isochorismatase family protein n=2 Tax=Clostridium estertheticum TaxID=238834 RepID=A0A1J0GKI5_9CLOT|nr:hypothetical protein A7L45_15600 [Clostridium estertheticum subsp. estertheticum]
MKWKFLHRHSHFMIPEGWELDGRQQELQRKAKIEDIESIELVELCTDICMVTNVLLLKAYMPEIPIYVDASCCTGVTPEKHKAA